MSSPRKIGPYEYEDDLFEAFKLMKAMVEEIYHEIGQQRNPKVEEGESSVREEGGVGVGGPSNLIPIHPRHLQVKQVYIPPKKRNLKKLSFF
jgi:hypothetical protein